ncbi:phosphotyrosine protein phosphatase [Kingella kingae]|uniref:phosphotyrosine protein phosphatase n=1 Tax=Kingella kingae TaxID=504 RepID=UPI00040A6045|nr:phosphotyrosine protein phosphatase [Kingella kingae]MDK4543843.1 phosphotyrosine protein phosphatase [Kingella kingae]MDK4566012.1 phosphotyrosine protein phosphatase [Kingella kingae]MDK4567736.1 phosphotyrosine protein phosphatase [Kingella kingae]MDK4569724.1 phosphotyrosine protein phosphatase [Kingella kingae]MDK4571694.1 phosphotyrosine protein phosphatase [Kingella kingae]
MEEKHKLRLKAAFPRALQHKSLTMLDIPDDYHYMDIELIELLQQSLQDYL